MFKDLVYEKVITNLNKLDNDQDTLVRIDWSTRRVFFSQAPNKVVLINSFIEMSRIRKSSRCYFILSAEKLASLKADLLRYVNNPDKCILVPDNKGFEILELTEVIIANDFKNVWVTRAKYKITSSSILVKLCKLFSKSFREIHKYLSSIS